MQTEEEKGNSAAEELEEDKGADLEKDQGTSDDDKGTDDEADKHRKAFEDQKRRAEKAEARVKELETQGRQGQGQAQDNKGQDSDQRIQRAEDRATRAELAANGIKTREEQDFVIAAAKRLGVDPSEAASDDIVSARLEKIRDAKRTKEATPAPGKGGGAQKSSKLPDFSKMTNAEFDEWERKNR